MTTDMVCFVPESKTACKYLVLTAIRDTLVLRSSSWANSQVRYTLRCLQPSCEGLRLAAQLISSLLQGENIRFSTDGLHLVGARPWKVDSKSASITRADIVGKSSFLSSGKGA